MVPGSFLPSELGPKPLSSRPHIDRHNMSYSLNSLKGVIWEAIWGTTLGVIKGDTRSLDDGTQP